MNIKRYCIAKKFIAISALLGLGLGFITIKYHKVLHNSEQRVKNLKCLVTISYYKLVGLQI